MNGFIRWRKRPPTPLGWHALPLGTGFAAILFADLMVPSYGAKDIIASGGRTWQPVAMAAIANLGISAACGILAKTGYQPRRFAVAAGMALAAGLLLVPAVIPLGATFVPLAAAALGGYALAAGAAQFSEQTTAIARAPENARSQAVGRVLFCHLLAGIMFGGIPFFFSWQAGEETLSACFAVLALLAAVKGKGPSPGPRESYPVKRLFRETGIGSLVIAAGQAAWTGMYLVPALHGLPAPVIAAWAGAAQGVALVILVKPPAWVDRHRPVAAVVSGSVLLASVLGVAILPATFRTPAGTWAGGLFFVLGEAAANLFVAAVEGGISLEEGGQRAQLVGQASKFLAVAGTATAMAALAAVLNAVEVTAVVVGVLGALLFLGLWTLRARQRVSEPSVWEIVPGPTVAAQLALEVVLAVGDELDGHALLAGPFADLYRLLLALPQRARETVLQRLGCSGDEPDVERAALAIGLMDVLRAARIERVGEELVVTAGGGEFRVGPGGHLVNEWRATGRPSAAVALTAASWSFPPPGGIAELAARAALMPAALRRLLADAQPRCERLPDQGIGVHTVLALMGDPGDLNPAWTNWTAEQLATTCVLGGKLGRNSYLPWLPIELPGAAGGFQTVLVLPDGRIPNPAWQRAHPPA